VDTWQKQKLYFKTKETGLENRCGVVNIPSLIFAVTPQNSYVVCFEGNERPNQKTELYFSPFLNVWDDHNICMGSTKKTKKGDTDEWTKAFFNSAFTHTNYRSVRSQLKRNGDRYQLWRDLLDNKLENFLLIVFLKQNSHYNNL